MALAGVELDSPYAAEARAGAMMLVDMANELTLIRKLLTPPSK